MKMLANGVAALHLRLEGEPHAIESAYDALPWTEIIMTDGHGTFFCKRPPNPSQRLTKGVVGGMGSS